MAVTHSSSRMYYLVALYVVDGLCDVHYADRVILTLTIHRLLHSSLCLGLRHVRFYGNVVIPNKEVCSLLCNKISHLNCIRLFPILISNLLFKHTDFFPIHFIYMHKPSTCTFYRVVQYQRFKNHME